MLVAVSACHGRHELTKLWAEHTASLGFDGVVVCASLEEHSAGSLVMLAAMSYKNTGPFHLVVEPNDPLAGKFNSALKHALDLGATRIMVLPSDDFVSQEWVDIARHSTADYIIPNACGVYSPESGRAYVIRKNYPTGTMTFGAGRVISRNALEEVGTLWPPNLNRGLDTASNNRLAERGFKPVTVQTETIPITDVKTSENIWAYNTWEHSGRPSSPDEVMHMVSPTIRERLKSIR